MKELIEITPTVIGKRLPVHESVIAIERQCRLEPRTAPRLETKPTQAASMRFANNVLKAIGLPGFPASARILQHIFFYSPWRNSISAGCLRQGFERW